MLYNFARAFLFARDPEWAHDFTIHRFSQLRDSCLLSLLRQNLPAKPVKVMGIEFPNPVGLAAGLDKNGECINVWDALGFGFVEIGTITPRAQPGNDSPRIFRLVEHHALINRMGFNNKGVDHLVDEVKKSNFKGVLGINIGKNKDTPVEQGKDDYLICMDKVYPHASYIAVNISSPNTPGLRSLQYGEALDELLVALKLRQSELAKIHGKYVPLAVKIAPDLDDEELAQVATSLINHNIDGVIATNTTLERSAVAGHKHADEAGGLSGRPVAQSSTQIISKLSALLKGEIPIIGVGGIDSAEAAQDKINAGASLVQLYTGFIYEGPPLIKDIVNRLKL
ncbi:quinone-dependent dihydroorotate dehydrogenase [Corallincola luteus]|uniref:Dihydroorotate dehydrogenase (quinone) n=1 Tax=Corallincola luteus TaxID=1775177 RepID=A0ABY2AKQ0_9GAMM|nr:quinone-dependent dihydroorotate dehydrogenase [Corallincola luteus]TCI03407.1 quinone-dependent dihydroorotate dehydrogenase [Corallincola luteus]